MGCWAEWAQNVGTYAFSLSGALIMHQPKEFVLDAQWRDLRTAASASSALDEVSRVAELLLATASAQVEACWAHGGRYWDADVRMLGSRNQSIRFGMCAPWECSDAQARQEIVPAHLRQVPSLKFEHAFGLRSYLSELSHWSAMALDFAIVGIDNCGTTSLHRNLERHPNLAFTSSSEDWLFYQYGVLPRRSKVEQVNAKVIAASSGQPRRLLGLKNPTMWASPVARSALSTIKDLRVIVIVCDLMSRFEKYFWRYHYCRKGVKLSPGSTCKPSIAAALEDPKLLEQGRVSTHLREVASLFGPDALVLHQDDLRNTPHAAYSKLTKFLGVQPFPSDYAYGRYNSRKGHRTDLCRNESLQRRLKRVWSKDYATISTMLTAVGYPPQHWKTRCERPDELADDGRSCSQYSPCEG